VVVCAELRTKKECVFQAYGCEDNDQDPFTVVKCHNMVKECLGPIHGG
jgi:hypothetical protein